MILTRITLFVVIIQFIYCEDNYNIDVIRENNDVNQCIKSLVQNNFPCGTLVHLVNCNDGGLIRNINDEKDCYSFITRPFNDQDWSPASIYIIKVEDVDEFSKGMLSISKDMFWNPRARFIIELSKFDEGVDKIFEILLQLKVFDVIVLGSRNDVIFMDTYNPYKDNNCGTKLEVQTVRNCKDVQQRNYFQTEKISLRNCTIKVAAIQDIPYIIFKNEEYTEFGKDLLGIEQLVLETIAEKEGITLEYIVLENDTGFEVVLDNYTATGLLTMLQLDEADIVVGGFALMRNRVLLFDYLWGYSYAAFTVFTPAAGEEIWKAFYTEFGEETWLVLIIAYCLFATITSIRRQIFRTQTQQSLALELWGYFFLNASVKLCKENRFRATMVFWIWFTFMMNNFYTTALSSLLTGRDQTEGLITFDHIRELPYEPCISTSTRTFFLFAFNQTLPEGPDYPECMQTDSALDYVAEEGHVYAIEMEYLYKINDYKSNDEHSESMLDIWRFSASNVICMILAKGFPLRDRMQSHILRIYESGLLQQQLNKIIRVKNHSPDPVHHVHYEDLSLSDLRVYFYALFFGFLVSILCFVVEVIWHRRLNIKPHYNFAITYIR